MNAFFPGFERRRIEVSGASINLVHGGTGPAVLLLHGYPQTHCIRHRVALGLRSRLDSSTIRPQAGFGQTIGIYGKTYSW